jgi:hypothetical protein
MSRGAVCVSNDGCVSCFAAPAASRIEACPLSSSWTTGPALEMDTEAETTTAGAGIAVPATSRAAGSLRKNDSDSEEGDEGLCVDDKVHFRVGETALDFQYAGKSDSHHDEDAVLSF